MDKCFALKDETCQVISTWVKQQCNDCPFHRSPEELAESQSIANARLAGLDKDKQKYIAETYYKKEMPWLGGGK